jgi:hypothetical protein
MMSMALAPDSSAERSMPFGLAGSALPREEQNELRMTIDEKAVIISGERPELPTVLAHTPMNRILFTQDPKGGVVIAGLRKNQDR